MSKTLVIIVLMFFAMAIILLCSLCIAAIIKDHNKRIRNRRKGNIGITVDRAHRFNK